MHWAQHVSKAVVGAVRLLPFGRGRAFKLYDGLAKRLIGTAVGTTNFGMKLSCDLHDYIPNRVFHFGHWEPEVGVQIKRILEPGDVFVDVGANVGYDTLLASGLVGPSGTVVSIEASPRNFALLAENVRINALTNVRAVNVAVSDRVDEIDLYAGPAHNKGRTTLLPSRGLVFEARVRAAPLHEILTKDELARVKLVKMDIEGAECMVLRSLLANSRLYPADMQLIVEVSPNECRSDWMAVFEKLVSEGYSAYAIENVYRDSYYVDWVSSSPLSELKSVPSRQQDVLFTKALLPSLS